MTTPNDSVFEFFEPQSRRIVLSFTAGVLVACVALFVYLIRSPDQRPHSTLAHDGPTMADCIRQNLAILKASNIDNILLRESTLVCYTQIHSQGLLNDFQLRRMKFIQQTYDEQILLWMVVVITISGVGLAGIQLVASYRLAAFGLAKFDQSSELSVEQNRLSLKSSITGLFILIVSFAFFWVFVLEIFVVKNVNVDSAVARPTDAAQQVGAGTIAFPSAKQSAPPRLLPQKPKEGQKN